MSQPAILVVVIVVVAVVDRPSPYRIDGCEA